MKITDIEVGMKVRVSTLEGDNEFKGYIMGKVGEVTFINEDLTYPIEVDFGWATEDFKPEDLEKY